MKSNVLQVYQSCSPGEVLENKDWYVRARLWCEHRAGMYNLEVRTVAGVISALSPRNKWERNLIDADQLLYAVFNGYSASWVVSSTFMKNVLKAYDIALYQRPELAENGLKTQAFLNCIADPSCDAVVIDVWSLRVVLGDMSMKAREIKHDKYEEYSQAYRLAGKEVGLLPMEMQAVTWCAARGRKKAKVAVTQMSMF